ncbi:unnamed protein product [Urochloa humidicola]
MESESEGKAAVPLSVHKRKTTEPENQQEEEEQEDLPPGGGVIPASMIRGSKHADGSIYRQDTHFCHRLYRLDDIRETRLKPANIDTKKCSPHWSACRRHTGCAMMQIFSLNLANHSAAIPGGPIELYGFMAVRDLLDPLRNYVFNRTRDDPLVLYPSSDDPSSPLFIQMASPKRGIYLQARALIEFDMKIKRGEAQDEDLQLIDGACTFSELTPFHGVYTQRIPGVGDDHGAAAVDISVALLRRAVEARIHVTLSGLPEDGLRLSLLCNVSKLPQEIQLFDGFVDKSGVLINGFVVAAVFNGPVVLYFKGNHAGRLIRRLVAFPAKAHGCSEQSLSLVVHPAKAHGCSEQSLSLNDVGVAEVKVSWANIPF